MKNIAQKLAIRGILIALAFIFSYVESLIPIFIGVPGIKAGIANIVTLLALYMLGWKDALTISVVRVTLNGFTFGNLYSLLYSMAGALLSFLTMLLLKKSGRFSIIGVSAAGGYFHNIGQLAVAYLVLGNAILYYLPILMIAGTITGSVIGFVCLLTYKSLLQSKKGKHPPDA